MICRSPRPRRSGATSPNTAVVHSATSGRFEVHSRPAASTPAFQKSQERPLNGCIRKQTLISIRPPRSEASASSLRASGGAKRPRSQQAARERLARGRRAMGPVSTARAMSPRRRRPWAKSRAGRANRHRFRTSPRFERGSHRRGRRSFGSATNARFPRRACDGSRRLGDGRSKSAETTGRWRADGA